MEFIAENGKDCIELFNGGIVDIGDENIHEEVNPIPYGISIPAMLRGGVFFTPPAKNILRSDRFKFLYTYQ